MSWVSGALISTIYLHKYCTFIVLYPCSSIKCLNHKVYCRYSEADTNSNSVALFVFIFDKVDLVCAAPIPKETNPPVWLLMLSCTAYDESKNDMIFVIDAAPIILTLSIVLFSSPTILLHSPIIFITLKNAFHKKWYACFVIRSSTLHDISQLWPNAMRSYVVYFANICVFRQHISCSCSFVFIPCMFKI